MFGNVRREFGYAFRMFGKYAQGSNYGFRHFGKRAQGCVYSFRNVGNLATERGEVFRTFGQPKPKNHKYSLNNFSAKLQKHFYFFKQYFYLGKKFAERQKSWQSL
jgi:hypothetical protein